MKKQPKENKKCDPLLRSDPCRHTGITPAPIVSRTVFLLLFAVGKWLGQQMHARMEDAEPGTTSLTIYFFFCNKSQLSGLRSYAIRVLCSFVFQVERKDSLSLRIKQPKRDRFFSSLISHLEHWTKKKRKVFPRSDIVIFGVILDFYRVTYTNSNTKTKGIKMQFIFRSRHKLLWTCHCFQIDGVNTIFVDIFPSLHATQMVKVLEMRRIVTTYRRFMHIVRYLYSIENCISDSCLRQFLLLPLAALPRQIW